MKKSLTKLPLIEEGDFHPSIMQAIAEGTHAEYLQKVTDEYEWYRAGFEKAFSSEQSPDAVYAFHIVYKLKKDVSRDVEILGSQSFERLARCIITSMGWDNDHMHGFTIVGPKRKPLDSAMVLPARLEFFAPHWEDDPYPTFKSDGIRICQIDHKKFPKLEFIFDFGDGHRFGITFLGTRERTSDDAKKKFPLLIDQRGVAPEQYPNYE